MLVLTARNRTDERIAGLNAGADDYLGKPFDLGEVEARLRALVRRAQATQDQVQVGALALDRLTRRFSMHGQALDLPAREFEVLWELMTPAGRVVSKRELSDKLSELRRVPGRQRAGGLHLAPAQEAGGRRRAHPHAARPGLRAGGRGLKPERLRPLSARLLRQVLPPLALTWLAGTAVAVAIAYNFTQRAFDRSLLEDAYVIASNVQLRDGRLELRADAATRSAACCSTWSRRMHFSVHGGRRPPGRRRARPAVARRPAAEAFRFHEVERDGAVLRSVSAAPRIAACRSTWWWSRPRTRAARRWSG